MRLVQREGRYMPLDACKKPEERPYLASAQANHEVSDEGVLCLSRAVAHHHSPAVGLSHLTAKDRWK